MSVNWIFPGRVNEVGRDLGYLKRVLGGPNQNTAYDYIRVGRKDFLLSKPLTGNEVKAIVAVGQDVFIADTVWGQGVKVYHYRLDRKNAVLIEEVLLTSQEYGSGTYNEAPAATLGAMIQLSNGELVVAYYYKKAMGTWGIWEGFYYR